MFVPFEKIPSHSRLWIYQANRQLSEVEKTVAEQRLKSFTENWKAHNHPLKASYKIELGRFILLAVDEDLNDASGCSIDSSVEVIRSLEKDLHIILLDRSSVAYRKNGFIQLSSFKNIKEEIKLGNITPETIVFNNTINQVAELNREWQKPAKDTWLKRFF